MLPAALQLALNLAFLTGYGMAKWSGQNKAGWVHASMALLVIALGLAYGFYTPTLRRQIAALEARGPEDPEYLKLGGRGQMLGGILAVFVLAILYLMVFKPF